MVVRHLKVIFICTWLVFAGAHAHALQTEEASAHPELDEARALMMRDPSAALDIAQNVEQNAPDTRTQITAAWLQSEALTRLGRPLDARPLAERALDALGPDPEPTKLYADILVSHGRAAMAIGDYQAALVSFKTGFDVFIELDESRSQAIVLQSIGSIYSAARQYEHALEYFERSSEQYQDPSLELAASNNRANAYRNLDRYQDAIDEFQAALGIAAEINSPVLEARILNNKAALHVAFGNYQAAEEALLIAFSKVEGVPEGEWVRFLHGVQAQIEYQRGNLRTARASLERTLEGIGLDETTQHFAEFHELGANVYADLGAYELALAHLEAFKRLDDEARDIAASANSALLAAEFDFASQALEIQQLRGEQLEQSLKVQQAQARTRLALAGGLVLVLLLIGGFGWLRFRMSRIRQKVLTRTLNEDSDTGLPTRHALQSVLETRVNEGDEVYIYAISLDRYSHLNGVLGFKRMAELTQVLAERVEQIVGANNVGLVAPGVLGAVVEAEFSLEYELQDALNDIAKKLRDVLCKPAKIDGVGVDVTVTIGAIAYEQSANITQAMIAIDQAKQAHTKFAIFDQERYGDPTHNLALMTRMVAATQSGDITLHYQPKLNLRTRSYDGAEALCRWTDPERGMIPPDQFIPLSEETGHIRELTEWSLDRLVIDQLSLAKMGVDLNLAVNISGALLCDKPFAQKAAQIASRTPGKLTFEVTEGAVLHDVDAAMHTLNLWSKAGIKIAIDDYGTGQSSLAYLRYIPADELKLDRVFVSDLETSRASRMMVKSTIDLAHNLGMQLTAEGLEDAKDLTILGPMGCDCVQGYGLARPMPLIDMIGFLQNQAETPQISTPNDAASGQ